MGTSTHNLIVLKELEGNPPVQLDPVQQFLAPYTDQLVAFWVAVWFITLGILLVRLVLEYLEHRKNTRT